MQQQEGADGSYGNGTGVQSESLQHRAGSHFKYSKLTWLCAFVGFFEVLLLRVLNTATKACGWW
jgi:preprotein translocase subunit SecG